MQFGLPNEREQRCFSFDKQTVIKKSSIPILIFCGFALLGIILYAFGLWYYFATLASLSQATEERQFVWFSWISFPVLVVISCLISYYSQSVKSKVCMIIAPVSNMTVFAVTPVIMYSLYEFQNANLGGGCTRNLPNSQPNPACSSLNNAYNSFQAGCSFIIISQLLLFLYGILLFYFVSRSPSSQVYLPDNAKYKIVEEKDVTTHAIEELERTLEMNAFKTDDDFKID